MNLRDTTDAKLESLLNDPSLNESSVNRSTSTPIDNDSYRVSGASSFNENIRGLPRETLDDLLEEFSDSQVQTTNQSNTTVQNKSKPTQTQTSMQPNNRGTVNNNRATQDVYLSANNSRGTTTSNRTTQQNTMSPKNNGSTQQVNMYANNRPSQQTYGDMRESDRFGNMGDERFSTRPTLEESYNVYSNNRSTQPLPVAHPTHLQRSHESGWDGASEWKGHCAWEALAAGWEPSLSWKPKASAPSSHSLSRWDFWQVNRPLHCLLQSHGCQT